MKRIVFCFVLVSMLLSLCACTVQEEFENPVNFYYLRNGFEHGTQDSLITSLTREGSGMTQTPAVLLNLYLRGPSEPGYTNPFPADVSVHSTSVENGILYITLSQEFADLTGIELTLACACLARTCIGVFPVSGVQIAARSAQLDGQNYIYMDEDVILLLDNTILEEDPTVP